MRLGVSPAAASTARGVFNHRFEALFPRAGGLGCTVCLAPQLFLPVYPHVNEGPPAPPATALLQVLSTRLPISTCPTGLNECLFFISWLLDFHTVRFSVSSGCFLFLNCCCPFFGCARRHSVSTYASILAGSLQN